MEFHGHHGTIAAGIRHRHVYIHIRCHIRICGRKLYDGQFTGGGAVIGCHLTYLFGQIRNHKVAIGRSQQVARNLAFKFRSGYILNNDGMGHLIADIAARIRHGISTHHGNRAVNGRVSRHLYSHQVLSAGFFQCDIAQSQQFVRSLSSLIVIQNCNITSICHRIVDSSSDNGSNTVENGNDMCHLFAHITARVTYCIGSGDSDGASAVRHFRTSDNQCICRYAVIGISEAYGLQISRSGHNGWSCICIAAVQCRCNGSSGYHGSDTVIHLQGLHELLAHIAARVSHRIVAADDNRAGACRFIV